MHTAIPPTWLYLVRPCCRIYCERSTQGCTANPLQSTLRGSVGRRGENPTDLWRQYSPSSNHWTPDRECTERIVGA